MIPQTIQEKARIIFGKYVFGIITMLEIGKFENVAKCGHRKSWRYVVFVLSETLRPIIFFEHIVIFQTLCNLFVEDLD